MRLTKKEQEQFIKLKTQLAMSSKVIKLSKRRAIRYKIFRIRDGVNNKDIENKDTTYEYDMMLKKVIEKQFTGFMSWLNFSFDWDVGANDPLKIVTSYTWLDSGGKFENRLVPNEQGTNIQCKVCSPTAFTKQEI